MSKKIMVVGSSNAIGVRKYSMSLVRRASMLLPFWWKSLVYIRIL